MEKSFGIENGTMQGNSDRERIFLPRTRLRNRHKLIWLNSTQFMSTRDPKRLLTSSLQIN